MTDAAAAGKIEQLEFLTKLQRVLSEGLFTASYKYALILVLAELSVERPIPDDGILHIGLNELASRFIALYWRQAAPFSNDAVLSQNRGRPAMAINKIFAFRASAPTLALARQHPAWPALVRQIARLLVEMPLWKLQRVGSERLDFLYEERLVDDGITLRPGIADCFRQQFTLSLGLATQGTWDPISCSLMQLATRTRETCLLLAAIFSGG